MKVIYIGREFYYESASIMSSVYEITPDGFLRTDWGFIEVALEEGKTVNIRPATPDEKDYFILKLKELNKK